VIRNRSLLSLSLALAGGCETVASPRLIEEFREAHEDFVLSARSRPPVWVEGMLISDAELDGEPGSFDMTDVRLDAAAPLPLGRDHFLVVGAAASRRDYDFDGAPVADDTLSYYGLRLGYGRFLNDDFVVQGYWQPSVYSDFDGTLNSRDWRLWYGDVLAVWRTRPNLFWKLGVRVNDALDTGVIPLLGLVWHFTDEWAIETLLPRDAMIVYRPDEDWRFAAGLANQSEEYHLRGPSSLGEPEQDVHVQESTLFIGAERKWGQHLSTFMRAGTTIKGDYDWGYGGGFPEYEGELEPSTMLMLGVGYWF
jgi:hypothetical protein